MKKANLTFRYKLEAFEDDLKDKIKNIPEEKCDLGDPFQISTAISNLLRLGLLISEDGFLKEGVAERIEKEPYVQKRFKLYKKLHGGARISVSEDCVNNLVLIDPSVRCKVSHFIYNCFFYS